MAASPRTDGRIDWLNAVNARLPKGGDCGYADFMASVDMLVMGRHTCNTARAFIMRQTRPTGGVQEAFPMTALTGTTIASTPRVALSLR